MPLQHLGQMCHYLSVTPGRVWGCHTVLKPRSDTTRARALVGVLARVLAHIANTDDASERVLSLLAVLADEAISGSSNKAPTDALV